MEAPPQAKGSLLVPQLAQECSHGLGRFPAPLSEGGGLEGIPSAARADLRQSGNLSKSVKSVFN